MKWTPKGTLVGGRQMGRLLYDIPIQTLGARGHMKEDPDPLAQHTAADVAVEAAQERERYRAAQLTDEQREMPVTPERFGPIPLPHLMVGDIEQTAASTGFSTVSMIEGLKGLMVGAITGAGAGLAGGPAAPVTVPLGAKVGGAAGMLAWSGRAAYKMDKAMVTRAFFDSIEQSLGRELTDEERAEALEKNLPEISRHALWEAGPEAMGNLLTMTGLGRVFMGLAGRRVAASAVRGFAQALGGEYATETVTQTGQVGAEHRMGMTEEPPRRQLSPADQWKSFKEIAAPTTILTGVMGGGAAAAGMAARPLRRLGPRTPAEKEEEARQRIAQKIKEREDAKRKQEAEQVDEGAGPRVETEVPEVPPVSEGRPEVPPGGQAPREVSEPSEEEKELSPREHVAQFPTAAAFQQAYNASPANRAAPWGRYTTIQRAKGKNFEQIWEDARKGAPEPDLGEEKLYLPETGVNIELLNLPMPDADGDTVGNQMQAGIERGWGYEEFAQNFPETAELLQHHGPRLWLYKEKRGEVSFGPVEEEAPSPTEPGVPAVTEPPVEEEVKEEPAEEPRPPLPDEPWVRPPTGRISKPLPEGKGERDSWGLGAAHGQEKIREIRKARDELEKTLAKTRRNAHKKRRNLQAEITEKNRAIRDIEKEQEPYKRRLDLAIIEDKMEAAPTEAHWLPWAYEREGRLAIREGTSDSKAREHTANQTRYSQRLQDIIAKQVEAQYGHLLNEDELRSTAERVYFDWGHPSETQTLASSIKGNAEMYMGARSQVHLSRLQNLRALSDEDRAGFKKRLEAVRRNKDWFQRSDEIIAEATKVNDVAKAVAEKELEAEREKQKAKRAVSEKEEAQAKRKHRKALVAENRFWDSVNEKAKKIKGKEEEVELEVSVPTGKNDAEGNPLTRTVKKWLSYEPLPGGIWAIRENWKGGDPKNHKVDAKGNDIPRYSLIHIGVNEYFARSGVPAKLRQLVVLLDELGADLPPVTNAKEFPAEASKRARVAVDVWEDGSLKWVDDKLGAGTEGKLLYPHTGAAPTPTKADIILDSGDFAAPLLGNMTRAKNTIAWLAEEVAEFAYDPVFTVHEGELEVHGVVADRYGGTDQRYEVFGLRLVYRDGYKFSFAPELFGLHPGELKPGMTVGVNLEDMGIKRKAPRDVVKTKLEQAGFVVKKTAKGLNAVWGPGPPIPPPPTAKKGAKAKPGPAKANPITVTGQDTEWGAEEKKTGLPSKLADAQAAINGIRWVQPPAPTEPTAAPPGTGGGGGVEGQRIPEGAVGGFPPDYKPEPGPEAPRDAYDQAPDETTPKVERVRMQPLPGPELIRLIKELLGKVPQVKKLQSYLGFFDPQPTKAFARMVINAISAREEGLLAKVLAHEIGHLVDWLGIKSMNRGNILGRIASLAEFGEAWIAGYPGGPQPLTEEERNRLKKEAKRLSQKGVEIEIEEEIVQRFGITPEDVLAIWNSVEGGVHNPDLLRYIKQLSAVEKLSIVKEAMRGVVADELQQFTREVREKTGRTIKQVVEEDATAEQIHWKYQEMLRDEIEKRMLLTAENIRDELLKLTMWWTPYDPATSTQRYIKYRREGKELYAEALSVFFNAPGELAQRAPEFYRGFQAWLNEKPEFLDAFLKIQDVLNQPEDARAVARRASLRGGHLAGDEKLEAIRAEEEERKRNIFAQIRHILSQYFLRSKMPLYNLIEKTLDEDPENKLALAAYYTLSELSYTDNPQAEFLSRMHAEVQEPLYKEGITRDDIGEFLYLRRITDREGNIVAYPHGFTPETAAEQLESLRRKLGDRKFDLLEDHMQRFHDLVFGIVESAVEAGVYSRELFENVIVPNKDNYAAFAVVQYLETRISPMIQEQVGTFKPTANVYDSTVMKMMSLVRLVDLNRGKNATREFMLQHWPESIKSVPVPRGNPQLLRRPPDGKDYLVILEDGKHKAYLVAEEIADGFRSFDIGRIAFVGRLLSNPLYGVFHRLFVSWNPGFLAANPMRDLRRTYYNLGAVSEQWESKMERELLKKGYSKEDARKHSRAQVITLGEVLSSYWKAKSVAARRAAGIDDATIDEMFHSRALSIPFVEVESHMRGGEAQRLMRRFGIGTFETAKKRSVPILGKVLRGMEWMGNVQETAGKVSAWQMITKRQEAAKKLGIELISDPEKAFVVREYAGTPNFKERGLWTPITNSLFMYSNVRWQGLVADLRLARKSGTRSGWWFRRLWTDIASTTISKAFKYGAPATGINAILASIFGGGDDLEEEARNQESILGWIGTYFFRNYDVVPLGQVKTPLGLKTVFFTIPKDEMGQLISGVWSAFLDAALELGGVETRAGSPQGALAEAADTLYDGLVPNLSPPLLIAQKWAEFFCGRNPRDNFYGADIVPKTEWEHGGWQSTKKMMAWTEGQFGSAGQLTHILTAPLWGRSFEAGEETLVERIVNLPVGWNRYVRVSNRGLTEDDWAEIQANKAEAARFKLGLPDSARYLTKEHYRKSNLDAADAGDRELLENLLLKEWYNKSYLPLTKKIRLAIEKEEPGYEAEFRAGLAEDSEWAANALMNLKQLPMGLSGEIPDAVTANLAVDKKLRSVMRRGAMTANTRAKDQEEKERARTMAGFVREIFP